MEETEKASIHGGRNPASLHKLNEELHVNIHHSPILHREQSPPSNREFLTDLNLPVNPPPMTCLEESLITSQSKDAPKIKDQVNSVSMWKCSECDKVFNKEKALFGHKRVHSDRGSKVSEEAFVIPEQKTVSMTDYEIYTERRASRVRRGYKAESITDHDIDTEPPFSKSLCATEKGGWDVHLDVHCSAEEVALFLVALSQSDGKTHTCEICNKSFSSQKTFCGHFSSHSVERKNEKVLKPSAELKRKREVVLKPSTGLKSGENKLSSNKKLKSKSHICEKCGKEYATGQELGGHKRAHYNKPLQDQ